MSKTLKITNGDCVRSNSLDSYVMIDEKRKIEQDIKNVLSTDIRKNGLGSSLNSSIGKDSKNASNAYSFTPVMFDFQMLVRGGIEKLRRFQRKHLFSQRTAKELIHDFSPVEFWPDLKDTRIIRWKVSITTVDRSSNFSVNGRIKQ